MKKDDLIHLLKTIPEREPPQELHSRIMAALAAKKRSPWRRLATIFTGPVTLRFQPLRLAAAGLACALFFGLGILAGRSFQPAGGYGQGLPPLAAGDRANYFLGRGLLAAGEPEQAARYLARAALLSPGDTAYEFWQGVAYGLSGQQEKERATYRQVLDTRPDFLPALINLGHNLLQSGDLDNALAMYNKVLRIAPDNREALYNRGLIYHLQGDRQAEAAAWKRFLATHRSGRWAYRALEHLNNLGDYSYRSGRIGLRRIIFHQAALLGSDETSRQQEVRLLAEQIATIPSGPLNLVLFQAGDAEGARKKVIHLQSLFRSILNRERPQEIRISWFGEAETVRTDSGRNVELESGLLLFSAPAITMNSSITEKRI